MFNDNNNHDQKLEKKNKHLKKKYCSTLYHKRTSSPGSVYTLELINDPYRIS